MVEINQLYKLANYLKEVGLTKESVELINIIKSAGETYIVKPGDTLSEIANGDIRYQRLIEQSNPNIIPDSLMVGQKINLPPKPTLPNAGMTYSNGIVEFIKRYEGRSDGSPHLYPYDDGFGNITVGWGHKLPELSKIRSITIQKAEQLLKSDLEEAASFIRRNIDVKLRQHQFDALVSLIFNVGGTAFHNSELFKYIDEGRFDDAAKLLSKAFIGENQKGLIRRRFEEAGIFRGGFG